MRLSKQISPQIIHDDLDPNSSAWYLIKATLTGNKYVDHKKTAIDWRFFVSSRCFPARGHSNYKNDFAITVVAQ